MEKYWFERNHLCSLLKGDCTTFEVQYVTIRIVLAKIEEKIKISIRTLKNNEKKIAKLQFHEMSI